jgi:hypothetical protein
MKKLVSISVLCALALPTPIYSFPTEGLSPYNLYRKELFKIGWKPVPNNFGRGDTPELTEFPELVCARTFCTGIFRTPTGKKTLKLTVWMKVGLDSTEYYVAPQINFLDKP